MSLRKTDDVEAIRSLAENLKEKRGDEYDGVSVADVAIAWGLPYNTAAYRVKVLRDRGIIYCTGLRPTVAVDGSQKGRAAIYELSATR
jgi:predicted transcriptional regulator